MSMHFWLIHNGMTVVVLLPVVWLLCRLFRWRPACQHWLWLMLLIKLLLPPMVFWTLPDIHWPQRMTSTSRQVDERHSSLFDGTMASDKVTTDNEPPTDGSQKSASRPDVPRRLMVTRQTDLIPIVMRTLLIVWLTGIVVASYCCWRRILVTHRLMAQSQPATPTLQLAVNTMATRFGRGRVATRISGHVTSPSVIAWGQSVLVWPEQLTVGDIGNKFEPLLAHEMAHLQRGDQWVVWLELVTGIIWWWNPVYWLICRQLHETRELACDAIAIRATGDLPHDYALRLLELTTGLSSSETRIPIYGVGAVTHRSLRRRLKMVFERRLCGRMSILGCATMALLALPLLPTWSWGENDPKPILQTKDLTEVASENPSASTPTSTADKAAAHNDQPAAKTDAADPKPETSKSKIELATERFGAVVFPRPVHPGLVRDENVMTEISLDKDSPVVVEIGKLSQSMVNDIQQGFGELMKDGPAKKSATLDFQAKVGLKYELQLKALLTPEQFARLRQIHWQKLGSDAIRDSELANQLKITIEQQERMAALDLDADDQQKELKGPQRKLNNERRELLAKGESVNDIQAKIQEIQQKINALDVGHGKKLAEILTPDQQTKLAELMGKPFDNPRPRPAFSGLPGMPIRIPVGGLMGFALREPILKELGIDQDDPKVAQIRKLSAAYNEDMRRQFGQQVNDASEESHEKIRQLEGELKAKYSPELKGLLTPEQYTRLQQVQWQQMGVQALNDVDLANALEITKYQRQQLFGLNLELQSKTREILNPATGGGDRTANEEQQTKTREAMAERDAKVGKVLTKIQLEKWEELKGKPFDLSILRLPPSPKAED